MWKNFGTKLVFGLLLGCLLLLPLGGQESGSTPEDYEVLMQDYETRFNSILSNLKALEVDLKTLPEDLNEVLNEVRQWKEMLRNLQNELMDLNESLSFSLEKQTDTQSKYEALLKQSKDLEISLNLCLSKLASIEKQLKIWKISTIALAITTIVFGAIAYFK